MQGSLYTGAGGKLTEKFTGESEKLAKAMLGAIDRIGEQIKDKEGVSIWVEVKYELCEKKWCCLFWRQLRWVSTSKWHHCSAGSDATSPELGFKRDDVKGIQEALPTCVDEAKGSI